MGKTETVSRQTVAAAKRHILDGVDIADIDVPRDVKERIERVAHVLRQTQEHPESDAFALLRNLAAGRYGNASEEWHVAKKDMALLQIIHNS